MRSTMKFKVIGLFTLVVSALAISASGAQAAPEWMEAGTNITGTKESKLVEGELVNKKGTLLTEIAKLAISVTCTAAAPSNLKLIQGGITTSGHTTFTGCKVFKTADGSEIKCEVNSLGAVSGTVKGADGQGVLELHTGSKPVTLILPNNVKNEVVGLEFHVGFKACPVLPECVPVFGTLALQDRNGKAETELTVHEIIEEPELTALYAISNTPEHAVTLDGILSLFLNGKASAWSGLAG